jgi:hypothetical protein
VPSTNVNGTESAAECPTSAQSRLGWLRAPHLFAPIFVFLFLSHAPLLRLPYFWDEAGYFIPAARDLLLTGDLIPKSTLSNAHPPLLMIWMAGWWKLSAYTPAVTRVAMLLVAAFTLLGVFTLARRVSKPEVAVATTVLTALYPVFFAQSSLAHLDMLAAGFTMWGLAAYVGARWKQAILWFGLAGLAKETAIVAPMAICAWELIRPLLGRLRPEDPATHLRRGAMMLLSLIPVSLWFGYHFLRTGYLLGNPEYFRYNVAGTLSPERFVFAFVGRIWELFGYLNMFVLTIAAALAMTKPPIVRSDGYGRRRISLPVQGLFFTVIAAYLLMLSCVGGAPLARYLLPVYPLVILICVSTLRRRVNWWPWMVAMSAAAFVFALFAQPLYRISPEDNLTYVDFVKAHKAAADFLRERDANATVLTAWPASDELTRPWLGYVRQPMSVVPTENFTEKELQRAAQAPARYDAALIFSTKYEPHNDLFARLDGWRRIQERYFDYHRDVSPEVAASMLGGKVVFQQRRGVEWVAVVRFDKPTNANGEGGPSADSEVRHGPLTVLRTGSF